MPNESIGSCGSTNTYGGLAIAELRLGIAFLMGYVGEPPAGCTLDIIEHEHDLGVYGTIGLCWEMGTLGKKEWSYYSRCESALRCLDDAVDWAALAAFSRDENACRETDEDETSAEDDTSDD